MGDAFSALRAVGCGVAPGALRGVPALGVGAYWRAAMFALTGSIRLALRGLCRP